MVIVWVVAMKQRHRAQPGRVPSSCDIIEISADQSLAIVYGGKLNDRLEPARLTAGNSNAEEAGVWHHRATVARTSGWSRPGVVRDDASCRTIQAALPHAGWSARGLVRPCSR